MQYYFVFVKIEDAERRVAKMTRRTSQKREVSGKALTLLAVMGIVGLVFLGLGVFSIFEISEILGIILIVLGVVIYAVFLVIERKLKLL